MSLNAGLLEGTSASVMPGDSPKQQTARVDSDGRQLVKAKSVEELLYEIASELRKLRFGLELWTGQDFPDPNQ